MYVVNLKDTLTACLSTSAGYPMIILLFVGGVLFARNSLRGQPKLQQRLVNLIVFTGFVSDVRALWRAPTEGLNLRSAVDLCGPRPQASAASFVDPLKMDSTHQGHSLWVARRDPPQALLDLWHRQRCRVAEHL